MQFSDLVSLVERRLSIESGDVFWSVTDIKAALNEGLRELSDATEWYEVVDIVESLEGIQYYDLRSYLASPFLSQRRIFNTETTRWLEDCDVRDLDFHTFRQWETITGAPQKTFLRGLWWMGLYPAPAVDGDIYKVWYTALPPDMENDTDSLDIPEEFQQALVEYALYDLLAQDAETKKAMAHWALYRESEERFRKYVNQRISLDRVERYV